MTLEWMPIVCTGLASPKENVAADRIDEMRGLL
jgi:hypothetical protein